MHTVASRGSTLEYLTVFPDQYEAGQTYPVIVCLHGFGADMRDLAGLAPAIDATGYLYICPNAPLTVSIGPGYTGQAWYERGGNASPAAMERALTALDTLLQEVYAQFQVAPGRVLLLGFSQGGAITYHYGLPRPDVFAGLVILSGALRNPDGLLPHLRAARDQPIFIAHGTEDPLVPIDWSRQAVSFLEAQDYRPTYHEYPMGHEINHAVLRDLIPWIHQVLPPRGIGL
jgi:phospholipase/carboxylesterase